RYDDTHDNTRKQQAAPVTKADLSKAIAQGRLRYRRVGDQYVVSQEDVLRLHAQQQTRPESSPKRDTVTCSPQLQAEGFSGDARPIGPR
ncbi:MAG TPA: hypothetical protein VFS83_16865, partial [Ktedonobacterales bacterium]|nr:hypothetical protein [Ktedonobacterales bacterium]